MNRITMTALLMTHREGFDGAQYLITETGATRAECFDKVRATLAVALKHRGDGLTVEDFVVVSTESKEVRK